jgi:hypothetical protein
MTNKIAPVISNDVRDFSELNHGQEWVGAVLEPGKGAA